MSIFSLLLSLADRVAGLAGGLRPVRRRARLAARKAEALVGTSEALLAKSGEKLPDDSVADDDVPEQATPEVACDVEFHYYWRRLATGGFRLKRAPLRVPVPAPMAAVRATARASASRFRPSGISVSSHESGADRSGKSSTAEALRRAEAWARQPIRRAWPRVRLRDGPVRIRGGLRGRSFVLFVT